VGSDVLMWEVEQGIKPLTPSEQQAHAIKKQQQRLKLRQKQLQVQKARAHTNKLVAQQTQIAAKTV
jgi:FixJ family two-component response regulator